MLIGIDHHSGVPIYRQIVDQVRGLVLAGALAPGAQLISVRDLARQLKVNPMTVSKAYARLEQEGILERQRGIGLFAAKLDRKRRRQARREVLERMLERAAMTALRLEVPLAEALRLLAGKYTELAESEATGDDE